MSRLFYTCPLEAAYMSKAFGVQICSYSNVPDPDGDEFESELDRYTELFVDLDHDIQGVFINDSASSHARIVGNPFSVTSPHYHIHPDSLPIFEPQMGDVVRVSSCRFERIVTIEYRDILRARKSGRSVIIMRDDKSFFMPESEMS